MPATNSHPCHAQKEKEKRKENSHPCRLYPTSITEKTSTLANIHASCAASKDACYPIEILHATLVSCPHTMLNHVAGLSED